MIENILSFNKHLQIYAKDKNSKYTYCSEAMAEIVGADSPNQMLGKTDHDFIWKPFVTLYHSDDINVMRGAAMINVLRPQVQRTRIATMFNTKIMLTDKNGYPSGVTGHTLDVTGYTIIKSNGHIDEQKNIFFLGSFFSNEYFTRREFEVFKYLLTGKSVEEISQKLCRSIKTIQTQIKSITNKLQCSHKSEIVPTAIKHGLLHVLDDISLEKK